MQDTELIEKMAHLEEREKSNTKRIDEIEVEIKENRELTIAVKEIATEMKHLREEQSNMNDRLKIIEEKPSKNWDNLKWLIITRYCNSGYGIFIREIRDIERMRFYE